MKGVVVFPVQIQLGNKRHYAAEDKKRTRAHQEENVRADQHPGQTDVRGTSAGSFGRRGLIPPLGLCPQFDNDDERGHRHPYHEETRQDDPKDESFKNENELDVLLVKGARIILVHRLPSQGSNIHTTVHLVAMT